MLTVCLAVGKNMWIGRTGKRRRSRGSSCERAEQTQPVSSIDFDAFNLPAPQINVYDTALKICADYCCQCIEVYLSLKSSSRVLKPSLKTLHSVLLSDVENPVKFHKKIIPPCSPVAMVV